MDAAAVYARVTEILRDVFDDDELVARSDMTAADVEGWDSLSNLRLIMAVERSFGIKFSAAEVGGLKNVGELVGLVGAKSKA